MNPKFPFLLCLLAAGVYLWLSSRTSLSDPSLSTPELMGMSFDEQTAMEIDNPDGSIQVSGDQLVANAADALINGSQIHAQARFKIDLMDQKLAAPGQYWQKGQGSGKSRLEFSFQSEQSRFNILQVCDGRYFYWFRKFNAESHLEYVDLRQVKNLGTTERDFIAGARAWNNVGGIASMLEHSAKAFQFATPRAGLLGEIPVTIVPGRWKQDSLIRLLEGQVDPVKLSGGDWWRHVPPHLPHTIELTLGADQRFPYFPYRIVFSQYQQTRDGVGLKPVVTMELFELEKLADIPDQTFRVTAVNCEPVDVTAFYVDRVEQFSRR